MSGKSRLDYKAVFTALLDQLPSAPRVTTITADFEAAVWKVMLEVFP